MLTRILLIVIVVVLALWTGWGLFSVYSTERPSYEVVMELPDGVEVRQYEEQTWISTEYATDNQSFRVLASYIFGGNVEGEKIAMTAPVVTDERMSFILPEGLPADSVPAPDGQPIEFTAVPPRKVATLRFSGYTADKRVERKTAELLRLLSESEVTIVGQPFLMRYNDPWTPPFLRRNEVAVEVQ
jgi:hypothetical protein